jgi:DNA repair exonuclease SbcCD ATPase subunit
MPNTESDGGIREEMNRKRQLSEIPERLRSLEEKIDRVPSQIEEAQPGEERAEEIKRQIANVAEEIGEVNETLERGIPIEGKKEFRRMRKKLSSLLKNMDTRAGMMDVEESLRESVREELEALRTEQKRTKDELDDLTWRLKSSADALDAVWWTTIGVGMMGGAVGAALLALVAWTATETLPQEWRMTTGEIERVRQDRVRDRLKQAMTEGEWQRYRSLLEKMRKRIKQQNQD